MTPNNALLTDAFSSLRRARGAANANVAGKKAMLA
jgi:hypothetical protein